MKYKAVATILFLTGLLFIASTKMAYSTTTKNYGTRTFTTPFDTTNWNEVWDLTKGDLTIDYTIDQSHMGIPGSWDNVWTEVGLRGEGASNWNPGPWNTYQGNCGGWMSSGVGDVTPSPGGLSLHDKFNLGASGGRGEGDYDLLNQLGPVQVPPIGSSNNYGIWFDRDTLDPYQSVSPGAVDGGTFNTHGVYHVIIHYHALDAGLGSMFATINGISAGFYASPPDWIFPPDYYPAGISFKGDMKHMQVFAGIWAPTAAYGYMEIQNLIVTGEPGVSDPLIADFTFVPTGANVVKFTGASHGGMPPYSYSWDFGDGSALSTDQNPTHTYASSGDYNVKLTVTPYRCEPKSVTKKIHAYAYYLTVISPYDTPTGQGWYDPGSVVTASVDPSVGHELAIGWTGTGSVPPKGTGHTVTFTITQDSSITWLWNYTVVGGEWGPITLQAATQVNTLQLLAPWITLALLAAASTFAVYRRFLKKRL